MKIAQSFLRTYLKPAITWTVANRGQIKNVAGVAALFGGLVALSDIDRDRFVRQTARFSLILGAATSWPGVRIIGSLMHKLYTDAQLIQAFGRNTNYEGNPLHIRHWVSLVSVALAIPIIVDTILRKTQKIRSKLNLCEAPAERNRIYKISQTNLAIWVIALTLFSRPVLHWGSQIARRVVK